MSRLVPCLAVVLLVACAPGERLGATSEPAIVCAAGATLDGIDVSHWDGDIDWAQVAGSGISFAYAKATEGVTFTDPKFSQNWAGMQQAGVVRGAYHFFHANDDPIAEADLFLQTIGPLEPGDLPPALDLEVTDGQTAATITQNAIVWLDYVAAQTGTTPILYSSKRVFVEDLGNAMGLDQHALLWDAQWGVTCPDLPDTYGDWVIWQTTDAGTIPGIAGSANVDLDTFNGSLADLQALTIPSSSSGSGAGGGSSTGAGPSTTSSGTAGTSGAASGATTGSGSGSGGVTDSSGGAGGGAAQDPGATGACSMQGGGGSERGAFALALAFALVVRRRRPTSATRR